MTFRAVIETMGGHDLTNRSRWKPPRRKFDYFFMANDQSVSPAPATMYCCPSSS